MCIIPGSGFPLMVSHIYPFSITMYGECVGCQMDVSERFLIGYILELSQEFAYF